MNRGADAFRVFRWGLRKYAWVVVLFVLGVGVVVPLVQASTPDVYEANALVSPVNLTATNLDMVPRYGDSVFGNGEVENEVRGLLGLGAGASVVPKYVELVSAQDNPSFTVIGRAGDPDDAAQLADLAASTFTREMNSTTAQSVGTFSIQSTADTPANPVPALGGGRFALVIGVLAGLIAGIGAVGLLLMLRRPVLDPSTAGAVTGTPVLGRVQMRRSGGQLNDRDVVGIAPLSRRLLGSHAPVVMLVSPGSAAAQRRQLASALAAVLARARRVRLASGGDLDKQSAGQASSLAWGASDPGHEGENPGAEPELVLVDGPTLPERAARSEMTMMLLVVQVGISETSLRQAAEEYLDGDGVGVVLVDRARGLRRPRTRRRASAAGVGTASDADPERALHGATAKARN
jgi:capsular polysaccharide biosynthesis protein